MVAAGAQDQEAVLIHPACLVQVGDGLIGAGVLHGGGDEVGLAVGPIADVGVGPIVHQRPVPEGHGGDVAAAGDEGWPAGVGMFDVEAAVRRQLRRVRQRQILGQLKGPVAKAFVDEEHLAPGFRPVRVKRKAGAAGEEAEVPILGNFPGVYFVA